MLISAAATARRSASLVSHIKGNRSVYWTLLGFFYIPGGELSLPINSHEGGRGASSPKMCISKHCISILHYSSGLLAEVDFGLLQIRGTNINP